MSTKKGRRNTRKAKAGSTAPVVSKEWVLLPGGFGRWSLLDDKHPA